MSDIIAKEKIYSKYEDTEQTLVHPETQVAQIVDFREGVINSLPEDVVYKGDNVSLLNNDADYINNEQATSIANTEISDYTYDKSTIDGKANTLLNDIDELLHDKDEKIQELKDKLDDTYDRLKEYMDANDFLNLAPKIGYYQESEMQVTSRYNINNTDGRYRLAPVITTDNSGKEVMYFIANNGGPDREENESLHKAYKINENSNWVYYNTMVIPYCLKSEINAGGKIRAILGCDNDYLIVQFRLADNTIKYYLIYTNFSFDENDWKVKKDISQVVVSHEDVGVSNIKPDTSEWLMHIKYIKDFGTLVVFSAISCKYYEKYWYRMRVFDINKLNTANVDPLIRTKDLEGFSNVVSGGDNYSFAKDAYVPNPRNLTTTQIAAVEATDTSGFGVNALCVQFNNGTNENNSVGGQVVYLHEQEILVITLFRLQHITMFDVNNNYIRRSIGVGQGNFAIVFKVPVSLAKINNTNENITLKTTANAYNWTDGYMSNAFTELYQILPRYGHNESVTGFARFLTGRCNNSSYDTYNGKAYYTSYNCSNKKWRYSRLINNDQLQSTKWGGVLTEKDYPETYVSDASDWGKAIMNGGIIMWDKIILSCDSAFNDGNRLLWVKNWRYIEDHANTLDIEPVMGQYQIVDDADTFLQLRNSTKISAEKTVKVGTTDWTPGRSAITSCRMPDKSVKYFHAEFIGNENDSSTTSETGHFDLYEYFDITDDEGFKIDYSYTENASPQISLNKSNFNLTNGNYSSDDHNIRINNYYCIYNPMANDGNGIFLISGSLEDGNINNPNFKYLNFIAVTRNGVIKTMPAPAGIIDINTTDTETIDGVVKPVTNNWRYFIDFQNAAKRKDARTLLPTAACCLDKNKIVISFTVYTPSGLGVYLALYTFNDDYTSYSVKRLGNGWAGISHGNGSNYDSMYTRGFLHYSGPKYGLCGLGIATESNYFNTYHNNIRTQKPMSSNNSNMSTNVNEKEFTDDEILLGLNTYRNPNNTNIYTVWLQATSGLVCYIPEGPIFLGGYYSVIKKPIPVTLTANLRTKFIGSTQTLDINQDISSSRDGMTINPSITKTVTVSANNYDANYIYLKRDPEDRNNLIAYSYPQRIIFDGSRQFNLILLAKVETDVEKCIKMTYYDVNIGYNDYSFQH